MTPSRLAGLPAPDGHKKIYQLVASLPVVEAIFLDYKPSKTLVSGGLQVKNLPIVGKILTILGVFGSVCHWHHDLHDDADEGDRWRLPTDGGDGCHGWIDISKASRSFTAIEANISNG